MDMTEQHYELLDLLERGASQDTWHAVQNLLLIHDLLGDKILRSRLFAAARKAAIDRSDLLEAAQDAHTRLNGSTARPHLELVRHGAIVEEHMTYLWEPYIPRKALTVLDGDPGVGKTGIA